MKTNSIKTILILISALLNPLWVTGQNFPGGGYQGGEYGSGGLENISGIPVPLNHLTTSSLTSFPNPFTARSTVRFSIVSAGKTEISVYDMHNRQVKILFSATNLPPGGYTVTWDGSDNRGNPVAKGLYYYKMTKSNKVITTKILYTGN